MDFARERSAMVERHLRARGIRDERVLAAMLEIPREMFVPERFRAACYADEPAPIGYGQTISQPYMTALMAECLELTGSETVLEVGAGSGYHAAVLGALAAAVVTIELIPELAETARCRWRAGLAGSGALCGHLRRCGCSRNSSRPARAVAGRRQAGHARGAGLGSGACGAAPDGG